MQTMTTSCAAFICVSFMGIVVQAQWIRYPTPGIPRLADGKPNLFAQTPRTTAGKPDLAGLWGPDTKRGFFDIAGDAVKLPMRPNAQALFEERQATNSKDHPHVRCLPLGMPLMVSASMKIIQTPTVMTVLYEEENTFRQLFLDGRKLPEDPQPTWRGYSIGHWDGDDLVIETAGLNAKAWLDQAGHPQSEALRLVERYTRRDFGHLSIQITVDDPTYYSAPWTVTQEHSLMADDELLENICLENEKDADHLTGK
jgi:hypothetical protein